MVGSKQHRRLPEGTFFGENRRSKKVAGFNLTETLYRDRRSIPLHAHALGYFCLLLEGSYWEQYGRRRVEYAPLSVAFHPPGEEHRGRTQGGRVFHVEIRTDRLRDLEERAALRLESAVHAHDPLVWAAERLYREFRRGEEANSLVLEGLALQLFGELSTNAAEPEMRAAWLARVEDLLREEFSRSLTVAGIAEELDVDPIRLSRTYRHVYGEPIGATLRRIRVAHVSRRLIDADSSLAALALEAGFVDQSHLTRVFKRLTGTTPAAFRRRHRGAARD